MITLTLRNKLLKAKAEREHNARLGVRRLDAYMPHWATLTPAPGSSKAPVGKVPKVPFGILSHAAFRAVVRERAGVWLSHQTHYADMQSLVLHGTPIGPEVLDQKKEWSARKHEIRVPTVERSSPMPMYPQSTVAWRAGLASEQNAIADALDVLTRVGRKRQRSKTPKLQRVALRLYERFAQIDRIIGR